MKWSSETLIRALKSLSFSSDTAHRETLRRRLEAEFRRGCPPAVLEDDALLHVAAAGAEHRCLICGAALTRDETGRRVCSSCHAET